MKRRSLRMCLDSSINAVFSLAEPTRPPPLPPPLNPLLLESATELARKIALGQVKSVDVLRAYIHRISEVNPLINAVVDERFQDALEESKNIDDLIARSDESQRQEILRKKPFLGIPVTTKNLVGIKGLLIDVGLVSRQGVRADRDAGAIEMMRKAGAIPLAITNVSEMAMWWESNNKLHGRTRNPYDLRRNAGGSSGGEGALLASAGSLIGVGTDIGGSIRMPAFFNGVFGHKPSPNLVSNSGQYPEIVDVQAEFLGTGPMCRYARDLRPMLAALVGPEGASRLRLEVPVDLRCVEVFYMNEIKDRSFLMSPVSDEVRRALSDVIAHLSTLTSKPAEEHNFPSMAYAFEIWNHLMMSGDCPKFIEVLRNSGSTISHPILEMLKWTTGQSKHTFPAVFLTIGEKYLPSKESETSRRYVALGRELEQSFAKLLNDRNAIFLCPTHPEPAPKHRTPVFRGFNFAYAGIFNVLRLPVTACAVRLGEHSGLPVGIQVVAGRNQDRLCLAVAEEIERAFGGWRDPSRKT
ncbi:fatty-acid amide hydrolase 2-like [Tropilaelaps mercedesae]|uniref:Fatty-acid amide hydrolase 2-like n=1 Tax=Tropilaelaps mercedesae TaxID=418985 RepID=A0A1V9XDA8_9ACAR|nr:fatty-acid amide hydrolase 2-like [Tropilaelaps mercedesae]